MAIGQNFYEDQPLQDISNLSRLQSAQALGYGDQAARYADPFMAERGKYQKKLSDLMENPGSFSSSPAYQFAYDQGLEALNRKGNVRSGSKMAALTKYGQGMAGQQYFNQAKLLSDLAMSGSSPASAGLSYARGTERSQDYNQLSAAAKAAGQQSRGGGGGGGAAQSTPWWMQPQQMPTTGSQSPGWTQTTYGQGGGSLPYSTNLGADPRSMTLDQLNSEAARYGMDAVYPDYGGGSDWSGYDPAAYAEQDYWGYE
jgi:hypothetical protein